MIELYFIGLDLQYRTPEMGFQVVKLKRTTSEVLKARRENKESFEFKVLKEQYVYDIVISKNLA